MMSHCALHWSSWRPHANTRFAQQKAPLIRGFFVRRMPCQWLGE